MLDFPVLRFELPPSLWPLVSRVAGCSWPLSNVEDGRAFVEAAASERLLPLLERYGPLSPPLKMALTGYRALVHADRRRTRILGDALAELTGVIDADRLILLKGMDYAFRLYPEPHLRSMADIDVLVPQILLDEVSDRLIEAGAVQSYPGGRAAMAPSHHERVFQFRDVTLEVHQAFIQQSRFTIDYDGVWDRRVPIEVDGVGYWRLSEVDAFVHHAVSMTVDELAVSLNRFVDAWLMLEGIDVEEAIARAREWSATHALFAMLRQMVRCLPETADHLPASWSRRVVSSLTARWLEAVILPDPLKTATRAGRMLQLWRKFWLMDGMVRRIRFAVHEGAVLWKTRGYRGP